MLSPVHPQPTRSLNFLFVRDQTFTADVTDLQAALERHA
jgi:hypothetical protein